MSTTTSVQPGVYFIADLCVRLGVSRRVVERLRLRGAFPVPELPALDKRPRWSAAAVDAFLASTPERPKRGNRRPRRRHVPTVTPDGSPRTSTVRAFTKRSR